MREWQTLIILLIPPFLCGCATFTSQIHGRTATEQYLVTEAIQRAVNDVHWKRLGGQRIKMDVVGVQSDEYPYIKTAIERELARYHSSIVEDATKATVEMTVIVQAVGTDIWGSNFGIPLLVSAYQEVPSAASGLSIFSHNKQMGYCRMEFMGRNPRTRELLWQIPVVHGDTYYSTWTVLGIFGPNKSSDIFPERTLWRPKGYLPYPRKDGD